MRNFRIRPESSRAAVFAFLVLAVVAIPAGAEIYRCSDGETIVFSDVPCSASAKVHNTGRRVSVVNSADGLDEIAASNKAFLDRRREALAQQRERAAQQRREAQQRQRRLEAIEQAQRTRTVVGHLGNSRFGKLPNTTPDPAESRAGNRPKTTTSKAAACPAVALGRKPEPGQKHQLIRPPAGGIYQ